MDISQLPPQIWTEQLTQATLSIVAGVSLPRTLQRIADVARELIGAEYTALGVPNEDGSMRAFVSSGMPSEIVERIANHPHGRGLLGAILEQDEPIRLHNMRQDSRFHGFPADHPMMTSFLGVPIIGRNRQRLGNLYLSDRKDGESFTEVDEKVVQLLASFAAIAIENATLHSQLQKTALHGERDRIAMELHDGVIQLIYAVGMKLEIIRGNTELDSEEDKRFQSVFDDLNHVIEDIRGYIHDLRSTRENLSTLQQRLRNLADHFRDFASVEVIMDVPNELPALSDSQRHAILQIVRESLANVARHAQASYVKVTIHASEKKLHVMIADDGVGFDAEAFKDTGHFGLLNLQQRAKTLGGNLQIESIPNQGTTIYLVVPLKRTF